MAKSAAQMSQAYQDAMGSAATAAKYKQGIDNTTVNPMELAATPQAEQLYLDRINEAVASGRRSAKLRSVPKSRWSNNAKNIGAQRLRDGAMKAKAKVDAHFAQWAPIYQNISDTVRSMPKGGRQASKDRANKAIDMLMDAAGRR